MSRSPETPSEQRPSWELDPEIKGAMSRGATSKVAGPEGRPEPESDPQPQPAPAKPSWLDGFGAQLRARVAASQQAVAAIPRPVALATAAILIVPAVLGWLAAAYIGGVQQKLGISLVGPDGAPDPVTAFWWSNRDDQFLVIGTQSGEAVTLGAQGNLREQRNVGAPIVGIEALAGALPVPLTLAPDQLTATPTGSLAQAAGFGPETCRSGFVWREATVDDLVCVPPEVRDQALADRAEAEAGRTVAAGCAGGLVPRAANPNDTACTTPQIAAEIIEQNQRHESRKLLPGSALAGTRRVQLPVDGGPIVGERGLFAVSTTSIIVGERATTVPAGFAGTKQAVEVAEPTDIVRLAQWPLTGTVGRASEVGTLEDVRVLAAQPGTDLVYAGDGTGTVYEIDASVQMSGTNPETYLREIGTQGASITAISVAAAPAEGMPSLVTAAADGTIELWWPEIPAPSRALVAPATSRLVMSRGSSWVLHTHDEASALAIKTEGHGDAIVLFSDGNLDLLAAPRIDGDTTSPFVGSIGRPFSVSPDGSWSAAYDRDTRSVITFNGILRRTVRSAVAAAEAPLDIALNPDGTQVAVIQSDGSAEIASTFQGDDVPLSVPGAARNAAFNRSGTQLALGLDDTSVAIYRAKDGALLQIILPTAGIGGDSGFNVLARDLQYTPNDRQLMLLDPNNIAVSSYAIRTQRQSDWQQIGPVEQLSAPRMSEDGKRLVARRGEDELAVYDVQTGAELGAVTSVGLINWAMSPDASIIATINAQGIDVYVQQPSEATATPPPPVARNGLELSADGSTLLLRDIDGKLHLWVVSGPEEALPIATDLAPDLTAIAAELAPDGSFVVVADSAGGIYLIDLPGLRRIGIAGHGSLVQRMLLSADGRLLASASLDGVVQITDLARARQLGALPLVTAPIGQRPERLQPILLADQPGSIDPLVQQFLADAGYGPVPIDGVLGIATRAAIARWQRDRALPPTGVPDEALLSAATPVRQSRN